eukprot:6469174-Amphidinium_carterae.1
MDAEGLPVWSLLASIWRQRRLAACALVSYITNNSSRFLSLISKLAQRMACHVQEALAAGAAGVGVWCFWRRFGGQAFALEGKPGWKLSLKRSTKSACLNNNRG